MRRKIFLAAVAALAAFMGFVGPASATNQSGHWWSGVQSCVNAPTVQASYYVVYDSQGELVRADGANVRVTSGNVSKVEVDEYFPSGGSPVGTRIVNYNGTLQTANFRDTPTTYLPWFRPYGSALVTVWSTAGFYCSRAFQIGQ